MKDMPALLLAVLAQKDVNMLARVFDQVVDNGKMLRNFAQIIRSGAVGRKSFGNRPKKLMTDLAFDRQRKTTVKRRYR